MTNPWNARWLAGGALVAGALALTAPASAVELRFAHVNTPGDPCYEGTEELARRVAEETDGRVTFEIFPKAQLGNQRELFTQLRTGAIDLSCTNYPILSDVVPEFLALNGGFFYDDWEQVRAVLDDPELGGAWQQRLIEDGGVRVLGSFYYGARNLTSNTEVHEKADLEGLKIRAVPNPISLAIVSGLGAAPTPVAFPELFQALRQGVVDGQENPIPTIYAQKFYEVQDYLVLTRHQINAMPFVINEAAFQQLSQEDREILSRLGTEVAEWTTGYTRESTEQLVEDLKAEGMTVIQPTDGALAEWRESVRAQIAQNVDGELWPAGLMDQILALQD